MHILESCPRENITNDSDLSFSFSFQSLSPSITLDVMGHDNQYFCLFNTFYFVSFLENTSKGEFILSSQRSLSLCTN